MIDSPATTTATRLDFTTPPPGLTPVTAFDLEAVEGAPGLFTLTDAEGAGLRLFVLDPLFYVPEYLPTLREEDLLAIGVTGEAEVGLYVVANIIDGEPVVNLLAPIVVNPADGAAVQLILDEDWPLMAALQQPAA